MLTATRTLVSQALCYGAIDRDDASRRAFVRTVVAFVYALKHQLRGTDPAADLRGLLDGAAYARVAAARFRRSSSRTHCAKRSPHALMRAISPTRDCGCSTRASTISSRW